MSGDANYRVIKLDLGDEFGGMIIRVITERDEKRLVTFLTQCAEFRNDSARFIHGAQLAYAEYCAKISEAGAQPCDFPTYINQVRSMTDEAIMNQHRHQQLIAESLANTKRIVVPTAVPTLTSGAEE